MEEGKRAMRALSPAFGRPSPDFGRGDMERNDVGERAATQSHNSTTNSIRTRNVKRKT